MKEKRAKIRCVYQIGDKGFPRTTLPSIRGLFNAFCQSNTSLLLWHSKLFFFHTPKGISLLTPSALVVSTSGNHIASLTLQTIFTLSALISIPLRIWTLCRRLVQYLDRVRIDRSRLFVRDPVSRWAVAVAAARQPSRRNGVHVIWDRVIKRFKSVPWQNGPMSSLAKWEIASRIWRRTSGMERGY